MNKAKDFNLLNRIKKQYKDLQKELRLKNEENENLKKIVKVTKINEFTIEIKTLSEEMEKLKKLYSHALQQNAQKAFCTKRAKRRIYL